MCLLDDLSHLQLCQIKLRVKRVKSKKGRVCCVTASLGIKLNFSSTTTSSNSTEPAWKWRKSEKIARVSMGHIETHWNSSDFFHVFYICFIFSLKTEVFELHHLVTPLITTNRISFSRLYPFFFWKKSFFAQLLNCQHDREPKPRPFWWTPWDLSTE